MHGFTARKAENIKARSTTTDGIINCFAFVWSIHLLNVNTEFKSASEMTEKGMQQTVLIAF